MLSINDLLNPVTPDGDAPRRSDCVHAETPSRPLSSPPRLDGISIPQSRRSLVEELLTLSRNISPGPVLPAPAAEDSILLSTRQDVRIGPRNTLKTLYHYSRAATLEYPETSGTGKIGHLFDISPDDYHNPRLSFAYSQGSPSGRGAVGMPMYSTLLTDDDGELVPCQESHYTCESHSILFFKSESR